MSFSILCDFILRCMGLKPLKVPEKVTGSEMKSLYKSVYNPPASIDPAEFPDVIRPCRELRTPAGRFRV